MCAADATTPKHTIGVRRVVDRTSYGCTQKNSRKNFTARKRITLSRQSIIVINRGKQERHRFMDKNTGKGHRNREQVYAAHRLGRVQRHALIIVE